ncbi:MAG: hypothetical protein KGN84_22815 [Acidobacteriota bacterium]|nr:hypothetical protein [Acidobacteriota bacterium]
MLLAPAASAHRLDEFLQAALISVSSSRMEAEIRMVPGVAVLPLVMASVDTDGNGVVTDAEWNRYAARALRDLSFTIDGLRLQPRLVAAAFPKTEDLKEGLGEIDLTLRADLPSGGGARRLVFENRHEARIGAYLVNCLAPDDPKITIDAQKRNYTQSSYELDYTQEGTRALSYRWLAALAVAAVFILRPALAWREHRGLRASSRRP